MRRRERTLPVWAAIADFEVAAARQVDAVRRLEVQPAIPEARPNLDGPRGPGSHLKR